MSYAVGIDLGTTNSVIAVYRRGVVETLPVDGRAAMPSVISLRDSGDLLVGQSAKSRMMIAPESTVASSKRWMGDRRKSWRIGSRDLSPVNVATLVLQKLVASAREGLGLDVWDAVITVPAYFNEQQREDTRRAGEEAGLNVLRLIPEPTAAAIAYGLDKGRDQTIMVYDLGGGTFDVSILEVKGNSFEVKAVGGDSLLGGDDFDMAIMRWAAAKFKAQFRIDLMSNKTPEGLKVARKLKEAAEAAKIELSQSERTQISIPDCLGQPLDYELSLAEYNALIRPMLDKTVAAMKATLKDARLRADDIDRVILVGGSTKNSAVREIVAREIKEPFIAPRVDEVVAHGGAIMAANLFLPEASPDNVPIEVSDVTAHSLGIDAIIEQDGREKLIFRAIIPRQSTYPCKMGFLGSTGVPMQDVVDMTVYRGEDEVPDKNERLGQLTLPVAPPSRDIVPIGAIFELDADGIIRFTAVQLSMASRVRAIIEDAMGNGGSLSEETIRRINDLVAAGEAKSKTVQVKSS